MAQVQANFRLPMACYAVAGGSPRYRVWQQMLVEAGSDRQAWVPELMTTRRRRGPRDLALDATTASMSAPLLIVWHSGSFPR